MTVSGYGADSFYLGDMEIPGDADLADYGEKLLELAGLSRVYYRVGPGGSGTENLIWMGGDVQKCDCRRK